VRNWSKQKWDVVAVLALFAVAVILYAPVLAPGKVLLPADLLLLTPPWAQESETYLPGFTHVLRRAWDPLFQFYPARKFLAESLTQGWLPLWNPHAFSGTPFAADGQSAIFYPINWLFAVLPLPFAFGAVAFVHSLLTGVFLYSYARRLGYTLVGSFTGAVVWMLCGVQVGWQMWQVVDSTLCWLPLCLFFWEGLRESGKAGQFVGLSVSLAMTMMAGHLQFAFYVVLTTVAYALFRPPIGVKFPFLAAFKRTASAVLIACLLSALQIIPTCDFLGQSVRIDVPINRLLATSIPPTQLGLLVMPELFGGEKDYLHQPFLPGDYYEDVIYCGASSLVFAVFALRLKRKGDLSAFWLGLAIFSLLMGCGSQIYKIFYYGVSLYKSFHGLSRIFVLFDFSIAMLAAQGVSIMAEEAPGDRRRTSSIAAGSVLLFTLLMYRVGILNNGNFFEFLLTHKWLAYGMKQLLIALLFIGASAVILLKAPTKLSWFAAIAVLIEMLYISVGINVGSNADLLYPPTNETSAISNQLSDSQDDRVLCVGDPEGRPESRIISNGPMSLGWDDASGSNPLYLRRYDLLIRSINLKDTGSAAPTGQGMIAAAGDPALDSLDVRWIVSPVPLTIESYSLMMSRSVFVYENSRAKGMAWIVPDISDPLPQTVTLPQSLLLSDSATLVCEEQNGRKFFVKGSQIATSNTVICTQDGPNRLNVKASATNPQLLVVSQAYCPGWNAFVDGKQAQLLMVDGVLTGIPLSSGQHQIVLSYEPDDFRLGAYLSCASWLFLMAFFWRGREQNRRFTS